MIKKIVCLLAFVCAEGQCVESCGDGYITKIEDCPANCRWIQKNGFGRCLKASKITDCDDASITSKKDCPDHCRWLVEDGYGVCRYMLCEQSAQFMSQDSIPENPYCNKISENEQTLKRCSEINTKLQCKRINFLSTIKNPQSCRWMDGKCKEVNFFKIND